MASMRDWLKGPDTKVGRVVVVHCKAGKGRSGTVVCSYLISEEGWTVEDALLRFTARRMRSGFGAGVSIPSQLRWVRYVDRWTKHRKFYVERQVEVVEVQVWGLRDGVKVAVEGYVDEGRTIKNFHTFHRHERIICDGTEPNSTTSPTSNNDNCLPLSDVKVNPSGSEQQPASNDLEAGANALIFRPSHPIILPTNDINIDLERRNKAGYGWTMVTSVAHVWFNTFFESPGSEISGQADSSGVFKIDWDAMDGIKGSARKGTRALDRLAVVWRAVDAAENGKPGLTQIITEPKEGEPVPEMKAADWKSAGHSNLTALGKDLGLRTESPVSGVSKASSLKSSGPSPLGKEEDNLVGLKTHGLDGEEVVGHGEPAAEPTAAVSEPELGMQEVADPEHSADATNGKQLGDLDFKSIDIVERAETGHQDKVWLDTQRLPGQLVKE